MKNVLCILSNGFEELEAVGAIALLRRAGICVDVYSLHDEQATGRFDVTISKVRNIKAANANEYDALLLPGGPHYVELETNETVISLIQAFHTTGKVISAICAAPTILGRMGLLAGKKYTCFTSMNEDFGGSYQDTYTVTDGQLITGRSAAAVIDFAFAIIEKLEGHEHAEEVKNSIYYY